MYTQIDIQKELTDILQMSKMTKITSVFIHTKQVLMKIHTLF